MAVLNFVMNFGEGAMSVLEVLCSCIATFLLVKILLMYDVCHLVITSSSDKRKRSTLLRTFRIALLVSSRTSVVKSYFGHL